MICLRGSKIVGMSGTSVDNFSYRFSFRLLSTSHPRSLISQLLLRQRLKVCSSPIIPALCLLDNLLALFGLAHFVLSIFRGLLKNLTFQSLSALHIFSLKEHFLLEFLLFLLFQFLDILLNQRSIYQIFITVVYFVGPFDLLTSPFHYI